MTSSIAISSSELPWSCEQELDSSGLIFSTLGPIVSESFLEAVVALFDEKDAKLQLLGHLQPIGYKLLLDRTISPLVHEYLRPLACSFTELQLSDEEMARAGHDPYIADRVMNCYIGNLMQDFQELLGEHPRSAVRGAYWSQAQARLVACQSRPRQLTPAFGQLLIKAPVRFR